MKIKKIEKDYFLTILDRLLRLDSVENRYERVFDDILSKYYFEKNTIINLDEKIKIIENIINLSVTGDDDSYINNVLIEIDKKYFKNTNSSYQYLSTRFKYSLLLNQINSNDNLQKNILWLKTINEKRENIYKLREKYSLLYPIEKIILCEGMTEVTLLKTIFNLFDYNFDKKGIYVMPLDGKNRTAKKYLKIKEFCKIPCFILLDKDASSVNNEIKDSIFENDKIYLLRSGEFEDIIPKNIIMKALNSYHKNDMQVSIDDFKKDVSMVHILEEIYRNYGFGDFKKAKFALIMKEYIEKNCTKNDFLDTEIVDILHILIDQPNL